MQRLSSNEVTPSRRRTRADKIVVQILLILVVALAGITSKPHGVSAFHTTRMSHRSSSLKLSPDDEINKGLLRAKELLAKSKAKLAAKEASLKNPPNEKEEKLPFFASTRKVAVNRKGVIKSKNAEGLVLADGERMAALSEQEEWERRGLFELFESEIDNSEDVYSQASEQLASRDVAASIFNLRKTLQQEDYSRIFDKRNYLIGEDN
jgi:hypothetical protein